MKHVKEGLDMFGDNVDLWFISPLPSKGLNSGIPSIVPIKGRGFTESRVYIKPRSSEVACNSSPNTGRKAPR